MRIEFNTPSLDRRDGSIIIDGLTFEELNTFKAEIEMTKFYMEKF